MAGLGLERELAIYLAHVTVERGLSEHTVAAYKRDLGRYIEYLKSQSITSIDQAQSSHVEDFAMALSSGADGAAPLAQSSQARAIVAVRGWHKFAVAEGWVLDNASAAVKPKSTPMRLPKAISIEDVELLLEAASLGDGLAPLRDKAFLELLYATGARVSEATGLDLDDLNLSPGEQSVLLRGKGRKERIVPLGSLAAEAIEAYVVRARPSFAAHGKGTPALFVNARGTRLSRQTAWSILKTAAESSGIAPVSPHTMRHSFATHLLRGGADIRVVQELLGHASVTTTQVYTLVTRDALREVYQASHPRAGARPRAAAE